MKAPRNILDATAYGVVAGIFLTIGRVAYLLCGGVIRKIQEHPEEARLLAGGLVLLGVIASVILLVIWAFDRVFGRLD